MRRAVVDQVIRSNGSSLKTGLTTALVLAVATAAPSVKAATLYWDSDANGANNTLTGTGLGATGTWNTSTLNWWPGSGTTDQAWVNGTNTAVFTGTAGTVSLATPITVGGLQFNTTGYAVANGANTLTFSTGSVVTLNNIAAATITGPVAGASAAVTVTRSTSAASTLTLNGTSTGGWTGATTIDNGVTLALSGSNQALLNTSAITLAGGITLTNTSLAEAALDRVSNTAAITSNGGAFTVTNTVAAATPYAETIGSVALTSGLLNVTSTNANTGGTESLTLSGLTHAGTTNTSSVAFSGGGGLDTATNQIKVTGATSTTVGQIIGPWATVGTAANAQTDYAVYSGANIVAANITASAETTWATTAAAGATAANTLSGATTLTATRNMNALRYTGGAGTLALGSNNLETNGILNGGSGTLTISGAGVIRQEGTAAGNLYVNAGSAGITLNSVIANNSTGKLTLVKTGTGTLTLGSANTYTGDTVVQEGTLLPGGTSRTWGNLIVGSLGGGQSATFSASGATTLFDTTGTYNGTSNVTVYSNGIAYLASDADGYLNNLTVVGGTVNLGGSFYMHGTVTMTGGSILGGSIYGNPTAFVTNASATTARITGFLGGSSPTFTVADGAAAVDLQLDNSSTYQYTAITKAGAGVMSIGPSTYTGATTVTGGTLLLVSSSALTNSSLANGGTGIVFDSSVSSHAFTIGGLNGNGGLALQDNASTPNAVALTLNAAGARSYSGSLTGSGSITKTGIGTQTFSSASNNLYSGATNISAGQLTVDGALANSAVAVANGAFLGGSGSVKSIDASAGGTVTPGTGAGILTSAGSVNLGSGHLAIDLNNGSPTAGTSYDQLSMTSGTVTLGGDLALTTGNALSLGQVFYILSNGGGAVSGVFSKLNGVATTLAEGSTFLSGGYGFKITYAANWLGTDAASSFAGGNDIALQVVPTPEPAAVMTGVLAVGGLSLRRRRSSMFA